MTFGIVVFPGSNCDADVAHVVGTVLGQPWRYVWHLETSLAGIDCVVLPGGFSYGDHLRPGAIARFSPIMESVARHAAAGGLTIGICNGFQVLVEAGLLPGALLRNEALEFRCGWVDMTVERADTPFTRMYRPGQVVRMPIAHGDGRYFVTDEPTDVVLRYVDNPNGSMGAVAGIANHRGNVFGLMPHPERCSELDLGGIDGLGIFRSIVRELAGAR
ncbi:MAG: phosphoribosylformylglycinamidine synthase subunit PurQ [Chloroflexota bacterium]|nr:MAG: phosphoribosylformylglycinamidine synthase subunit PurQ [Chloroflexota bacterium]